MPKVRRDRSVSCDGPRRASPFSCSSSSRSKCSSWDVGDVKEWEDARCPVCMEHPHNAVLLLCSSHEKGCRPYMCDTSYRHSNCLDQFRKAFAESLSSLHTSHTPTDSNGTTGAGAPNHEEEHHHYNHGEQNGHAPCASHETPKLMCPLCRGKINRWVVLEPARQFMNAKSRSCSREACVFSGTYPELRKHARREHPLVRPSEADPNRQRDWRRMERQRDLGDVLSTIRSASMLGEDDTMFDGEERGEDGLFSSVDEGNWWTVFLLFRVIRPGSNTSTAWSVPSRMRARRRSTRQELWGESYDGGESSTGEGNADEGDGDGSERAVDRSARRRRIRRRTTPEEL